MAANLWHRERSVGATAVAASFRDLGQPRAAALATLGLAIGATYAELRRAYRQKAKECHPDNVRGGELKERDAGAAFVAVQKAYEQLLDVGTGVAVPESVDEGNDEQEERFAEANVWDGRFAWELSAREVRSLGLDALRAVLWYSLSWGAERWSWAAMARLPPRSAGRGALEEALLPTLDELVRRELLIARAEAAGDAIEAARLRAGRSLRHQVRDAWLTAQEEDDAPRAAELRERFETLTEARADVTADEGVYPNSWDRDEAVVAEVRRARARARVTAGQDNDTADPGPTRGPSAPLTSFFRLATKAYSRRSPRPRALQPRGELIKHV